MAGKNIFLTNFKENLSRPKMAWRGFKFSALAKFKTVQKIYGFNFSRTLRVTEAAIHAMPHFAQR